MHDMSPPVSIILPTYNGERFIAGAIESVKAQDFFDWELLILDDGSQDNTATSVEHYLDDARIKYYRNENNIGIQKTLNRGLALARGDYIARIDDDDRWSDSSKLTAQVNFLNSNSGYALVGTGVIIVNQKQVEMTKYLPPTTDNEIRNKILSQTCFAHSSVVFRKDLVKKSGGYGESKNVRHVEDYDLWLRIGLQGKFANLPTYSVSLTTHGNSLTSKNRVLQARRALATAFRYKKYYPNAFWGILVASTRYTFFLLQSLIPLPESTLQYLKAIVKGKRR